MTESKIYYSNNSKGGPSAAIVHKSEWDRLEKQASAPGKPPPPENEYLKAMTEMSQEWMKTWPDTVQGCVALTQKKKEQKRAKEIAAIEAFSKKKVKRNNAKVIQEAKQKLFDRSCFGTKLISALLESKALEERDAQIDFIKEIKAQEAERERITKTMTSFTFDLDQNETTKEDLQKCKMIQNAKQNKEMYEKKKEEEAKAKEEEKLADRADAQLMKYLLEREEEAEAKVRLLEKQALDEYVAEHKKTKEQRAKREAEYDAKIEKCRKEQEELYCKIRKVQLKLYQDRTDFGAAKNFETIKSCQEKEKKRYEEFVEKSSKIGEERLTQREKRDKEKRIQDRKKSITIAEINKSMAEYVNQMQCSSKCFCERQCLIMKSVKPRIVRKARAEDDPESEEKPPPNFGPCNKLLAALKCREQEPPPWTGAQEMHVLFMRNAEKTLSECKYKKPARKVIDGASLFPLTDHKPDSVAATEKFLIEKPNDSLSLATTIPTRQNTERITYWMRLPFL